MKKNLGFKTLSSALLLSSLAPLVQAQAATTAALPALTYDSQGMPLCQLRADGLQFIRFEWKQDAYSRDIYVEKSGRTGFDAATGSKVVDLFQTECMATPARQFDSSTSISGSRQKLAENQTTILGYQLTQTTTELLSQVRLGGNVARIENEGTHQGFYSAHPIQEYTTELNRQITQKYGMGFSAQVYKDYIESKPKNAALKSSVENYLALTSTSDLKIGDRFKGYTFAVVRGYAFTLGNNARYAGMLQDFSDIGLDVKVLDNTPFGTIEDNRAIVLKELQDLIASGKKIILVPASKGGPEAIGALSDLAAQDGNAIDSVAAVLSLSSMIDGSFVVDFAGNPMVWPFAKLELFKQFNQQGGALTSSSELDPMLDMETKKIASFYEAHPYNKVTGPVYLNFVGTPLGTGLVKDPGVLAIQESVIRPHLAKDCGGSDGYIEFPGTEVPATDGMKTYTLAFNSSHAILDGDFEGHSMADSATRKPVLTSVLGSLADILMGSF